METEIKSDQLPITEANIKNSVLGYFNGIDKDKIGSTENELAVVETTMTEHLGKPNGLINIAKSKDEKHVAKYERTIENGNITEEHFVLSGKDEKGKLVSVQLFEDYKSKQRIPFDARINSSKRLNAKVVDIPAPELQDYAKILGIK